MAQVSSYISSREHIERMLSCLSGYIKISNSQGTTDINVACENLVILLMNSAYGYKLENYNGKKHLSNAAGIDLIDTNRGICVQVTSNQKKKKFEDTFKACKEDRILKKYKLLFFVITNKVKKTVRSYNDEELKFDGVEDIIDFQSLCDQLKSTSHERVIELDRRIKSWLGDGYYDIDEFGRSIENVTQFEDFKGGDLYYSRRISTYSKDAQSRIFERMVHPDKFKEYTLKEYVTGNAEGLESNCWLLIASGQAGKTYEVRNLYTLLKGDDSDVFPVYMEAKRFNHCQELRIPYYWQTNHIVFIIDGYDEISSDDLRAEFLTQMQNLQRNYPDLRIVLTSRRNYITGQNFLPNFQRLYLEDLSFEDVKNITYQSCICNPNYFLDLIEENSLYSLVYVPFYLIGLLDYYKKNGTIPSNRQDIYKYLIDNSFQADNERRPGSIVDIRFRGASLLLRVALVMQFTEKNELTHDDISDMGFTEEDIRCCLSYTLFHKDDKNCYRFEKNAFQLYYVAKYLSEKKEEAIINIISYRKDGVNRINPKWLDAFELLLSMIEEECKKDFLLNWTFDNHTEALLNIDPTCLESRFCHKVFSKVLQDYKELRISSSPDCGWSFDRKLAGFCRNRDSLEFFLQEYTKESELGPYLYLLSFVFWFIDPNVICKYGLQDAYKDAAFKHLEDFGDDATQWYEAPYIPFDNELFANSNDIRKLIAYTQSIKHILLKKSIYRLIVASKLFDEFVVFSINNDKEVHDFRRKNDSASVSVSRDNVIAALSNVSQYKSVKKVWQYLSSIISKACSHHDNDAIKILPQLLANTDRIINSYPDLKDCVEKAWLKDYKENHYYYNIKDKDNTFCMFNGFMSAHTDIDEIKDILYKLRLIYKDGGAYDDCILLHSKLFVRLKPGDITSLSENWGDDEHYRTVLIRLRYAPSMELDKELDNLTKNKYADFLTTLPQTPNYEEKRRCDKELAFNRKAFKEYVIRILNKYTITNRKQLRLLLKEDDELQMNDYLWQYIYPYRLENSEEYDTTGIRKSLNSKSHYAMFIVNAFRNDDDLTEKQLNVLKDSVETLLSAKRNHLDHAGLRICTSILTKYGFDVSVEKILYCIPYAGLGINSTDNHAYCDYIAYAVDKCGLEVIKPQIVRHLNRKINDLAHDTIDLLVQYAAYYSIKESYEDILRHIRCSRFPINLADLFYRNNEREGLRLFMHNFDNLPAEVQLGVMPKILKDGTNNDWAIDAIKRNKHAYNHAQNARAISYLVYLGDEDALQECLNNVRKDYKSLWAPHDVPSFNYTDTRSLPQIIELLELTWDLPETFNTWYSRLHETLSKMAGKNIEQFMEVTSALEVLVQSNEKYRTINYFIGELHCNQEPIVAGAKAMTTKEAIRLISTE